MTTASSPSTVLITGGAGDIGGAAATLLAAQGCRILLADHISAASRLHDRATGLRADGAEVHTTTFDVSVRDEVRSALDDCAHQGFEPDLVFNNAGFQGGFTRVDLIDSAEVEKIMLVNVVGAFNVIAETSARLIAAGRSGAMVNTASMAGVGGAPNMAGYSASKAAVIGLTKSSAKDLAPFGIRVNAVSPAFIGPGAMWDRQVALQAEAGSQYYASTADEVARQMIDMVPLRRYGSTAEVASVVAFLLSDAASYLTGVNIEVSGGSS